MAVKRAEPAVRSAGRDEPTGAGRIGPGAPGAGAGAVGGAAEPRGAAPLPDTTRVGAGGGRRRVGVGQPQRGDRHPGRDGHAARPQERAGDGPPGVHPDPQPPRGSQEGRARPGHTGQAAQRRHRAAQTDQAQVSYHPLEIRPTFLARTSKKSLVTSDPGATGKFSGIPLEIQ